MSRTQVRTTKRQLIHDFFLEHVGKEFGTFRMHESFGTAFRSRVREINRDPDAKVTIHNRTHATDKGEQSVYWSELRVAPKPKQEGLFA